MRGNKESKVEEDRLRRAAAHIPRLMKSGKANMRMFVALYYIHLTRPHMSVVATM